MIHWRSNRNQLYHPAHDDGEVDGGHDDVNDYDVDDDDDDEDE